MTPSSQLSQLPARVPRVPRARRAAAAPSARRGTAIAAGSRSPLLVGRGRTATATGLAHRLGWLEQEAALDRTPLRIAPAHAAPTLTPQLYAPAPPLPFHEGPAEAALYARSHGHDARLLGIAVTGDPGTLPAAGEPAPIAALTADAGLLRERPHLVVRLLAVALRAGVWARQHPDAATGLLVDETGLSAERLAGDGGAPVATRLLLGLDAHRELASLGEHHALLRRYGFLERDVDFGAWIDPRPLAAARELLAAERTAWV